MFNNDSQYTIYHLSSSPFVISGHTCNDDDAALGVFACCWCLTSMLQGRWPDMMGAVHQDHDTNFVTFGNTGRGYLVPIKRTASGK